MAWFVISVSPAITMAGLYVSLSLWRGFIFSVSPAITMAGLYVSPSLWQGYMFRHHYDVVILSPSRLSAVAEWWDFYPFG